ncbi:hypothetical protein AB0L67_37360 [Streptomyces flaveolus]|uniref:hypothetical protein n=1 Tax=Streptomyces flaveolus TaxID=67297 RepID=UPI0034372AB4
MPWGRGIGRRREQVGSDARQDGWDGNYGQGVHDWQARMCTITEMQSDISKWFDREVWTRAVNDAGYTVTCR